MRIKDLINNIKKEIVIPKESLPSYYGKVIIFSIKGVYRKNLYKCNIGDWVSLWANESMNNVFVYASSSIQGSGNLGFVPNKYSKILKEHLINKINYGISGPSTNNYDATIISIDNYTCTIEVYLYSPDEYKQRIDKLVSDFKEQLDKQLSAKYKMKKPFELKFELYNSKRIDYVNLSIKVFEKSYYLNNPYQLQILLLKGTKVIGESISGERDKIIRAIKANYNHQKIKVEFIEKRLQWITVLIEPDNT